MTESKWKHTYQRSIAEYFPTGIVQNGEVGLEIEVEGSRLVNVLGSYWAVHQDGSLRPNNGGEALEYVLQKPTARDNVYKFLVYLEKKLQANNAIINPSPRTSVHVHLNAQDQTILGVYNNIVLYLLLNNLQQHFLFFDN